MFFRPSQMKTGKDRKHSSLDPAGIGIPMSRSRSANMIFCPCHPARIGRSFGRKNNGWSLLSFGSSITSDRYDLFNSNRGGMSRENGLAEGDRSVALTDSGVGARGRAPLQAPDCSLPGCFVDHEPRGYRHIQGIHRRVHGDGENPVRRLDEFCGKPGPFLPE